MGPEWVAIIALIALFVVGTVLPINMGALAYVAAWLVGMYSLNMEEKDILAGVSGDLVLTLIGVTYLFAIAKNNGTVDLIVRSAVKGVGGRVALIPWVMFGVTALLTAIGAASPAAWVLGPGGGISCAFSDSSIACPGSSVPRGEPARPGFRQLLGRADRSTASTTRTGHRGADGDRRVDREWRRS